MTRALRYLLIAAAMTVSMLLFLLATVSDNTRLFDSYYSWIVGANVLVGTALFVLVLFLLARLISRYRRKRFGSRLMTRLVLMFTLIGVLPGLVIYLVSVQFVSRSIESWFNVKVETALESGLTLGRSALDASLKDLRLKARAGLRNFYLITLTLTLLLAIFAAMVSAFLLATDLAQPLLLLAEGTKAVAEGDLSPRPIAASSDELGTLTKSFNIMTSQLADARESVERNRKEVEDAKAYLESVLANMSAGVMVLDDQLRLVTFNASAEKIL